MVFYEQHQAETGKKQATSNTLKLNFCFLKIISFLHTCCHSKIVGHTLKNVQKNKWVLFWRVRFYDKKFNNKKACVIQTVRIFYGPVIKHLHVFQGVIWLIEQNVVKCFTILLHWFSDIYWLIHFNNLFTSSLDIY